MKRRGMLAGVLGISLTLTVLAQQDGLVFGSGGATGVYFPVATGIAKLMTEAGFKASSKTSGGSIVNILGINSGEFDMALAQNDIAFYAYNGVTLAAFDGKPIRSFRAVATLYPELVHVVALRAAKIDGIEDLKGKRVVLGDSGSGTEQNALQLLEAYGLGVSDLAQAIRVPPAQAVQLLSENKADAMFFTSGIGNATVSTLAQNSDVVLLGVNLKNFQALSAKYPFYIRTSLAAGTYKGLSTAINAVAVQAMWVASEKLSEDLVYNALKSTVSKPQFRSIHPNLQKNFNLVGAVRGLPVPLHSGAIRYFRERGVLR